MPLLDVQNLRVRFDTHQGSVRAVDDLYSTHPFNPIRIVALYRHWQSETCRRLLGHSPLNLGPAPEGQSVTTGEATVAGTDATDSGSPRPRRPRECHQYVTAVSRLAAARVIGCHRV